MFPAKQLQTVRPITTGLALACYCYSRHSLLVGAWRVRGFRVVIGGTIYGFLCSCLRIYFRFGWLVAAQAGIVIRGTIPYGVNLHGQVGRVVIQRTFLFCGGGADLILGPVPPVGIARTFSYGQHPPAWKATIVIGGTIPGARFSAQGCYSQHNWACGRPRRPHGLGLLFAAHFKAGCARGRISGILHAGLLFSAHFLVLGLLVFIAIPCFFKCISAVVIVCTFLRVTAAFPSYPPQQTKKKAGLLSTAQFYVQLTLRFPAVLKLGIRKQPRQKQLTRQKPLRILHKKFSCHLSCYLAHISKISKKTFSLCLNPPRSPKNIFSTNCAVNNNHTPLLLSAAQFQIIRLHPTKFFAATRRLLSSAHFVAKSPFCVPKGLLSPAYCCSGHRSVVIPGTMCLLFCAHFGCYRRHSFTLYLNKKLKA